MSDRNRLLGLCAAFLLTACAAADPAARAETDPTFDPAWRTFVWARPAASTGPDPQVYQQVEAAVGRALEARGYAPGDPAQFAIGITFGAPNAVKLFTHGPTYSVAPDPRAGLRSWGGLLDSPSLPRREPTEGMVTVDVFDAATREPVWRATSRVHLGRDADQADVDAVVAELLADFPAAS